MAIAYSYPKDTQLLSTDMLIGTATGEVNGRKKLITKNFTLQALGQFIITNYLPESFPSLQQVTNIGDTTTTAVYLNGGAISDGLDDYSGFQPNSVYVVNKTTGSGVEINSFGQLALASSNTSGVTIDAANVTSLITMYLPNKPAGVYTFATTSDVNSKAIPAGGTAGQILTKVDSTDYNTTWSENYADWTSVVKHTVKNNGATFLPKGTPVYVTGSNGTNMLVGKAGNGSEATSSKTMGLLQSDLATTGATQTGFVVTEGLLGGLNTAGQTAGDPVWLGPSGTLIYGLANKPYAPAHLVFIGIVTKISAGNGEIFVKVQNGFELKEIHDVDLITTTPINGDILGFDGTLWVNKTIASWLGYTPVTNTRAISTTAPLSGGGDLSADRTLSISQATTSTNGYLSSTDWNTFNGKFTLPSLTSGSVLFSNGTTITQDNSNLFWDNTNKRLGIGTTTPAAKLDVNGTTYLRGLAVDSVFGYSGNNITYSNSGYTSFSNKVLIGTTTDAGYKLDVNGTARVQGITTITPADLTGSAATSALDISQTWNTTGTPTAIKLNVTNTASNSLSNLIDLQVGGVSQMKISPNGILVVRNGGNFGTGLVSSSQFGLSSSPFSFGNTFCFSANGTPSAANITSGAKSLFASSINFSPTSGTATLAAFDFNPTINQTGGANGITRGLYINPTLTAAADFRAIETTAGNVLFGTSGTGFFWDNTNNRLGIGTSTPAYPLQIGPTNTGSGSDFTVQTSSNSAKVVLTSQSAVAIIGANPQVSTANGVPPGASFGTISSGMRSVFGFLGASAGGATYLNFSTNGAQSGLHVTHNFGNDLLTIYNNGNTGIGTTTDAGYKLDVNGTARVKGTGTTAATTSLTVQNSAGTNLLICRDDNLVQLNTLLPDKILFNGGTMTISVNNTSNTTYFYNSGTIGQKIQTQTGTNLLLSPGTVAGQTVVIESIGSIGASVNNSAILQTNSTTQGFLPPRMTTTQKNAIATPAAGLVVYDTTLNKLCVYTTTWETITSI